MIGRRFGCTRYTVVNAVAWAALATALAGCGGGGSSQHVVTAPPGAAKIRLQSPAFSTRIPRAFTCDGGGASPPLRWSGVPDRTRELALFVDDPDVPGGTFAHWTMWHLKPALRGIEAGRVPAGARQADNSAGKRGWTPPCPPSGVHRYVFTLVALRAPLTLPPSASPDAVRKAAYARALARGTLVGRYGR